MSNRAEAIEEAYGVEVPAKLRSFYERPRQGKLVLEDGFVRGTFDVDFDDDDLLDIDALCEHHFIDELDAGQWADGFADYVPFATLFDANADDEDEPVKSFLVVDVTQPACPVLLWDYDGWRLYPLAATLEDFFAGKATGTNAKGGREATPYRAFHWE